MSKMINSKISCIIIIGSIFLSEVLRLCANSINKTSPSTSIKKDGLFLKKPILYLITVVCDESSSPSPPVYPPPFPPGQPGTTPDDYDPTLLPTNPADYPTSPSDGGVDPGGGGGGNGGQDNPPPPVDEATPANVAESTMGLTIQVIGGQNIAARNSRADDKLDTPSTNAPYTVLRIGHIRGRRPQNPSRRLYIVSTLGNHRNSNFDLLDTTDRRSLLMRILGGFFGSQTQGVSRGSEPKRMVKSRNIQNRRRGSVSSVRLHNRSRSRSSSIRIKRPSLIFNSTKFRITERTSSGSSVTQLRRSNSSRRAIKSTNH